MAQHLDNKVVHLPKNLLSDNSPQMDHVINLLVLKGVYGISESLVAFNFYW